MGKEKFAKSVHFNLKNERDLKINKYIARRNFSGYVKKLILEDMKKKEVEKMKLTPQENSKSVTVKKQPVKNKSSNAVSPLLNLPRN